MQLGHMEIWDKICIIKNKYLDGKQKKSTIF